VLRLCSVKNSAKAQGENWVILNRQKEVLETQCSLFPICCRLPKLDARGSSPLSQVSRYYGVTPYWEDREVTLHGGR
jgi:hypothetical protein